MSPCWHIESNQWINEVRSTKLVNYLTLRIVTSVWVHLFTFECVYFVVVNFWLSFSLLITLLPWLAAPKPNTKKISTATRRLNKHALCFQTQCSFFYTFICFSLRNFVFVLHSTNEQIIRQRNDWTSTTEAKKKTTDFFFRRMTEAF